MMANIEREGAQTYREWEAEQIAKEERSQRYETEREQREMRHDSEPNEDEFMTDSNNQFMAQHV